MLSIKSRSVNDSETFEQQMNNLNEYDKSGKKVDLKKIFKMVASRDEKIRDELNAADYFVGVLLKLGVTEEMVSNLKKDMPKIIKRTKEIASQLQLEKDNRKSASKIKNGGQSTRFFFTIWIIFLLLLVQYLLLQIRISPDNLAGIQNTITMERDRMKELYSSNCTIQQCATQVTQRVNYSNARERREDYICRIRRGDIVALNNMLDFILNHGLNAHDMNWFIIPPRILFQTIPTLTVVVTIIAIMNAGAIISLAWHSPGPAAAVAAAADAAAAAAAAAVAPRRNYPIPPIRPLDIRPDDDDAVPEDFLCPIMSTFMIDPVIAIDGQTYDRDSILRNFELGLHSSPLTRIPIVGDQQQILIPNRTLRREMEEWWADLKRKKAAAAAPDAAARTIQRSVRRHIKRAATKGKLASNKSKPSGGSRRRRCSKRRTQTKRQNKK